MKESDDNSRLFIELESTICGVVEKTVQSQLKTSAPYPVVGEKLSAIERLLDYCLRVESGDENVAARQLSQLESEARDAGLRMLTRVFDAEQPHGEESC